MRLDSGHQGVLRIAINVERYAVAAHPARAQARQHYGIAEYEPPANPRRMSVAAGTGKPLRSGLNTLPAASHSQLGGYFAASAAGKCSRISTAARILS